MEQEKDTPGEQEVTETDEKHMGAMMEKLAEIEKKVMKRMKQLEERVASLEREREEDRRTITRLEAELRETQVRVRASSRVRYNNTNNNNNNNNNNHNNYISSSNSSSIMKEDNKSDQDMKEWGAGSDEIKEGVDIREYRVEKRERRDTKDRSKAL